MLRERRKRETKQLIFEQAIQLFEAKGFDEVTVQEIVDACGIAKGTFFNYFAKKEDILLHLGESQLDRLNEIMAKQQRKLEPKELIETIFNEMLAIYSEQKELMRLVVAELLRSALLVQLESRSITLLQEELEGIISRAKQEGKLHSRRDTSSIVTALVGVYFQVLMFGMIDQGSRSMYSERLREQLDIVWDGITDRERTV